VLDARGRDGGHVMIGTRRDGSLTHGGIDATYDGRHVALHWAAVEDTPAIEEVPVTKAMLLDCVLPD
jgi:hypothetical protein